MSRKWTTKRFAEYVFDNFGDEFEVRGEYTRNDVPILMYHKECDREFTIRPSNFKTRKRCSLCHGTFKKTTSQFKKEVFDAVGIEYEVLGEYTLARANIKMKHQKCGHEYETTPDSFLNSGSRCHKCAGNQPKNTDIFKKEVFQKTQEEYKVVGEYVNNHTPIEMYHATCGSYFKMRPYDFLNGGQGCPPCGVKRRSGKNHYKYNPKLTEEERKRRDMFNGEIKKWRTVIYKRDNYTCAKCGAYGRRLNAHHINSWNEHEDERFDLENGITLCESCHKDFHSEYGYGNNNEHQFNKFIATLF